MRKLGIKLTIGMLLAAGAVFGQTHKAVAPNAEPLKKTAATFSGTEPSSTSDTLAARLPIRRVVLYKNGVGYFEHLGHVHGDQNIGINFTSGQLNDVLKSLTILDLGGGRVTGVDYNSAAPFSQRLGELRLPLGEKTTVGEFLGALRGANLEVRGVSGGATVTGRLLSIERKTRVSGGTTLEVDVISLVTESGEVREVELSPAVGVRLAEQDLHQEVKRYLSLLASERDQDLRRMTISTAGSGDRQLYVSYISEVPVWKTTYRLVLPKKDGEPPLLQGWAIVDNTVGEDWNDVELSLVAGAPQSFIQQLSQPYYSRRPVVPLPESAQLTPQTHEGTLMGGFSRIAGIVTDASGAALPEAELKLSAEDGRLLAAATTDNAGHYAFEGLPAGIYELHVERTNFRSVDMRDIPVSRSGETMENFTLNLGTVSESVTVSASAPGLNSTSAEVSSRSSRNTGQGGTLGTGRSVGGFQAGVVSGSGGGMASAGVLPNIMYEESSRMTAAAQGQDLGDLFEYKLKDRITIHKNQSALVPIVQTTIGAEKVSLWNEALHSARPLRALWLTNSSSLTLDGGSFSVLEDEKFAGEGLLDPVKPGEKRLISYAADLAMRVDAKLESEWAPVRRVRISHGVMTRVAEQREKETYTVRNEESAPRTLVIEHPVRAGWKLSADGAQPVETSADSYRFRLNVGAKSSVTLTVSESKPLEASYQVTNLTDDQIALFLKQGSINPEIEKALRPIVAQKERISALNDEVTKRNDEMDKIYDDQQRLRENMKSLKGSPEEKTLTQRYVKELDDQETRLAVLHREIADFEAKKDQAQAELDAMIDKLSLDVAL
jgi:uncharacterized coiled-coil protein SlyX